ncbi:SDR family NAD(P)-dependent oxidoreductase [Rhodoferax sp.]|uniref:SDR family NAD(P)-dependent oxidoreductase n=1 Tax=Rhodoferax sp. TaxID=50421 RepID=UPI002604528E|nr:SDR family NAD(P)-dependent oxidoreductase [Rhodoferax sp.]MDD3934701.1 SDR family NAD(P)-dependent oxidoreductase [Rhodoferax sp.]
MTTHLFILTGASRGMGLAIAEQLLAGEHRLLCISRRPDPALDALAVQQNCLLEQWALDLSESEHAAACLKVWLNSLDPLQLKSATLINNAGVIPAIAPLSASEPAELTRALRVGLEAPMLLTASFLGATASWSVPRKVLNMSSGLGRRPMASQAAYCAAKAGMDHFTRCLALEEARLANGALVCSLAPGVIDTDMQEQLRSADAASFPDQAGFVQLKATGQLTTPGEAARRVLAWLGRPDFGQQVVADVRDNA